MTTMSPPKPKPIYQPSVGKLAKRCKCQGPWLERDPDGDPYCVKCGRNR
jgi:hypothetical protein